MQAQTPNRATWRRLRLRLSQDVKLWTYIALLLVCNAFYVFTSYLIAILVGFAEHDIYNST